MTIMVIMVAFSCSKVTTVVRTFGTAHQQLMAAYGVVKFSPHIETLKKHSFMY